MSDLIVSYHQISEPELDPWGMRVSAAHFSGHMEVLREVADPVPLIDLLTSPPRSTPRVAVTFDDGYFDNLSIALPILRRFDVPATVFVATGYIGKSNFWWDVLEDVLLTPGKIEGAWWPADGCVPLQPPPLSATHYSEEEYSRDLDGFKWRGVEGSRIRYYFEVYEALWRCPHEQRTSFTSRLMQDRGRSVPRPTDRRPLTLEELVSLSQDPHIAVGAHTVTHRPLNTLTPDQQSWEITTSKSVLESLVHQPIKTFAYPHGQYTDGIERVLATCDISLACTTSCSPVRQDDIPFHMPRFTPRNVSGEKFIAQLQNLLL